MSSAKITLGRDGMGDQATDVDFDAWVAFVSDRIDAATDLDVTVDVRGPRDVQDDRIVGDDHERQACSDAIEYLWDLFCASPELWPSPQAEAAAP